MAINRTRNAAVTLRLTAEELARWRTALEQSQSKNQTDFLMALLDDNPVIVYDGLVPVLAELKRQGNNLNQVARRLNEGDALDEGARKVLNECWTTYRKLLSLKLGE